MEVHTKWFTMARCILRHAALYGYRRFELIIVPPALFEYLYPWTRRITHDADLEEEEEDSD